MNWCWLAANAFEVDLLHYLINIPVLYNLCVKKKKCFLLTFPIDSFISSSPSTAIHIISFEVFSFRRLNKFSSMSIIFFLTFVLLDKLHTSENQFFFLFTQFLCLKNKISSSTTKWVISSKIDDSFNFPFCIYTYFLTHRGNKYSILFIFMTVVVLLMLYLHGDSFIYYKSHT